MPTAFREAHTNTPVYFELTSSGSYAKLLEQKNVFTEEKGLTLTVTVNSHVQWQLCKVVGTKECVYRRKRFNSYRVGLEIILSWPPLNQ